MLASDTHHYVGAWSLLLNALIYFKVFWMNIFGFALAAWQAQRQPHPTSL